MGRHTLHFLTMVSLLIAAPALDAQTASTGALAGRVTDPSGAVVPDAARRIFRSPSSTGQ